MQIGAGRGALIEDAFTHQGEPQGRCGRVHAFTSGAGRAGRVGRGPSVNRSVTSATLATGAGEPGLANDLNQC
jgi:hypothetical protein